MAPVRSFLVATFLSSLLSTATAHFELIQPPPLGDGNEDGQVNGPCGGVTVNLDQDAKTDFHVGGDAVAVLLAHPQANWLIRGTLDPTGAGNWTQLFPIVMQSGRGNFCEPAVAAPAEWAGKKGIISTVCNAPDGLLFQCAAVNFVSGANTSPSCSNGSAVSVSFTGDTTLAALVGASSQPSNTSTNPTPTPSGNSAAAMLGGPSAVGSFITAAVLLLAGAAMF